MPKFKYQIVFEHLKSEILSGSKKPGEKLPDINVLKKQHNTSTITINRALNELQNSGLINRIKGTGSFTCDPYPIKPAMTSLSVGWFISCIIPFDLNHSDFLNGVETLCKEKNLQFTIHNSHFSSQLEREIITEVQAKGAAGIIIYPVSDTENIDLYSHMIIKQYPFVIIDRKLNALDHPFVSSSNTKSFYSITEYLISKGHRRISFIAGQMTLSSTFERFQGYCQALIDAGIAIDNNLVVDHFFVQEEQPDEAAIRNILKKYTSKPLNVTALACANDFIASMIMQQASYLNIQIPEDLSITGFDNMNFASYLNPPLTTVSQPFLEIGKEATGLLADMIEDQKIINKTIRCPAFIVERKTVSTRSS